MAFVTSVVIVLPAQTVQDRGCTKTARVLISVDVHDCTFVVAQCKYGFNTRVNNQGGGGVHTIACTGMPTDWVFGVECHAH